MYRETSPSTHCVHGEINGLEVCAMLCAFIGLKCSKWHKQGLLVYINACVFMICLNLRVIVEEARIQNRTETELRARKRVFQFNNVVDLLRYYSIGNR